MPEVSIIIPNYNYAEFLLQRYSSITEQTYSDYEIIFLDDASTDNSRDLFFERFAPVTAKYLFNTANTGSPFMQWNTGVSLAEGDYVWIAEADDFCRPEFLGNMVGIMERYPHVGLAYCQSRPVDAAGRFFKNYTYASYTQDLDRMRWESDFVAPGGEEVRNFLALKNTIPNVSAVLFRKDAYIRSGGAETSMRLCGDWLAYCRVLAYGDIAFCSKLMNFHRQHPKKVTDNSILDLTYFKEFLAVQRYVFENFPIDAAGKRRAFRRFMGEWSRLSSSDYGKLSFKSHFEIARMTMERYPSRVFEIYVALLRRLASLGNL